MAASCLKKNFFIKEYFPAAIGGTATVAASSASVSPLVRSAPLSSSSSSSSSSFSSSSASSSSSSSSFSSSSASSLPRSSRPLARLLEVVAPVLEFAAPVTSTMAAERPRRFLLLRRRCAANTAGSEVVSNFHMNSEPSRDTEYNCEAPERAKERGRRESARARE